MVQGTSQVGIFAFTNLRWQKVFPIQRQEMDFDVVNVHKHQTSK